MPIAVAHPEDAYPESAMALEGLALAAGNDLDAIAQMLDAAVEACEQTGAVLRIHPDTKYALGGTASVLRDKAKELRSQATVFRQWLTGEAPPAIEVTRSSDGQGSALRAVP